MKKLNLSGARCSPALLARIATMLERDGEILVTGAYIDPNGAGRGALELGKSFAGYLSDRAAIKASIEAIMGADWMRVCQDLSLRDLFDLFVADAKVVARISAASPGPGPVEQSGDSRPATINSAAKHRTTQGATA
jgi:hypothetical protein